MKWIADVTVTLTFEATFDTDEAEEFTEEGSTLDPSDSDDVHDSLLDSLNDEEFVVNQIVDNTSIVSVDKATINSLKSDEKAQKKPAKEG